MCQGSHNPNLPSECLNCTIFTCSQNKALKSCSKKNSCWLFSMFQINCFLTFSSTWETTFSKTVQKTASNLKLILSTLGMFTVWKPPSLPSITEKDTAKYWSSKVLRSRIPLIKKKTKQQKKLTCMRSKMPSSLSEESTQKTKYKVA